MPPGSGAALKSEVACANIMLSLGYEVRRRGGECDIDPERASGSGAAGNTAGGESSGANRSGYRNTPDRRCDDVEHDCVRTAVVTAAS